MRTLKIKKITPVANPPYVYDITVEDNHNLFVKGKSEDTSILVHNCLDENVRYYTALQAPAYGLRRVAYQYGCNAYDEGEVGKADRTRMAEIPLDHIFEYASKDVVIPYQVSEFQCREAERRGYKQWKEFVTEQLGAMVLVFVGMENNGILVDKNYLIDLCSEEGEVNQLLQSILAKFKRSAAAKEVNEILVIQERVINSFKKHKKLLRKDKSTLGKLIKVLQKPIRILKKQMSDSEFVEATLLKQANNQAIASSFSDLLAKYDMLITHCKQLEEIFDLSPKELRSYNDRIAQYNLISSVQDVLNIYNTSSVIEGVKDLIPTLLNIIEESDSLAKFRSVRVDPEKEWLFDISKQASQQLLFFDILRLKPVDIRKDGGGTTNVDFQKQYQEVEEVSLLDNYTKSKKIMSTYIIGIMKQLADDADSKLDGRLHPDYGYRDVLTGRCLRGDVSILTDQGELLIQDIVEKKLACKVLTHTGNWEPIQAWFNNGEREVFEVETESGKKIYVTANHPLMTKEGWTTCENLSEGSEILTIC